MARFDFSRKKIWITGASSGIGAELALQLNAIGAYVILSARRVDKLKELQKRLAFPENSEIHSLDLTKTESITRAVDTIKKKGRLDLLIHNAGIAQKGLAMDNPMEIDRSIMETNFFGTIHLTKEILPFLREQGAGWIAVVSSIAGIVGVPGRSAYAASKHALHGYFESLRAECFDCNLEISMIMPGFVNTQITVNELKSDGTAYGKIEQSHKAGLSSEECAKRIIRKLKKKRKNIIVGGFEITSIYVWRFSPNLYDFLIKNHPVRKWRKFKSFFRSE